MITLHEYDFYAWTQQQSQFLKAGETEKLDIDCLIEELESMGISEKRALVSRLEVLLIHLLKWQYQPALQSRSWVLMIEEQRDRIKDHLEDNPSLKNLEKLQLSFSKAYKYAIRQAEKETGLVAKIFPKTYDHSLAQMMDINFYPDIYNS